MQAALSSTAKIGTELSTKHLKVQSSESPSKYANIKHSLFGSPGGYWYIQGQLIQGIVQAPFTASRGGTAPS